MVLVHVLAERVGGHIRHYELLRAGDRLGVAVSGGIDSVALLRLLLELRFEFGIVLSVVHFNHGLRGPESDADEGFVANLARQHDLEFYVDRDDVAAHSRDQHISLETAAREVRYGFFQHLLGEDPEAVPVSVKLNKIATGHSLDDQAETVLMRLIRGAGMRGLAAIYPRIDVENGNGESSGEIVRPLLPVRRCELESYLKDIDQSWREDSSNADHHFTRNRVRKLLIPLLEKEFNPSIAANLAELAAIAREEEDYWQNEIAGWMGTTVHWYEPAWARTVGSTLIQISAAQAANQTLHSNFQARIDSASSLVMNASVDRFWFLGEPVAVQRRLVRAIAEHAGIPLEFKHVDEIVRFATESGPAGKELILTLGWKLLREPAQLLFLTPDLHQEPAPADYEFSLPIPGKVIVSELGSQFEALIIGAAPESGSELDLLLDAECVSGPLLVRNWRPGDRFWPAHTKSPKKVKELLNELHLPHTSRPTWPVIATDREIVWVRGFPVCSKYRAKPAQPGLLIDERPLADTLEE